MAFEIGDKVLTTTGLYVSGEWRERGLKGKVVDVSNEYGGLITVKFKGIEEKRFLRPEYLLLRKKSGRPFKRGDTVALTKDVHTHAGTFSAGADAEVTGVVPDSNLVEITFISGTEIAVVEEALTKTEVVEDKQEETGPEEPRKFEVGDGVVFIKDYGNESLVAAADTYAEVIEVLPFGEVRVEFDDYTTEVVPEDVLVSEHDDYTEDEEQREEPADPDFESPVQGDDSQLSPDVVAAFDQIIQRLDEIKAFITQGPRQEIVVNVYSPEDESVPAAEEEPAPEPVFKKAKEVAVGDLIYTEGGAYDKVSRVNTTKGGYTAIYGAWGNQIVEVPSGRRVQVLEEV